MLPCTAALSRWPASAPRSLPRFTAIPAAASTCTVGAPRKKLSPSTATTLDQRARGPTPDGRMNGSQLPPWLFGIIIVSGFVFLAVAGLLLFQRFAARRLQLSEHLNNQ